MSSTNRTLHFSDAFAISCGTVTLDINTSKVLLIHWRKTGEYFLPKGRKDINETLEQTALRETFEETGFPVTLLPLAIPTLATVPAPSAAAPTSSPVQLPQVTEPIAVAQRVTDGKLKIIFWFAATADSTLARHEGTQQEDEDFGTVWVHVDDVASTLSFEDDRLCVARVVTAAQSLFAISQGD